MTNHSVSSGSSEDDDACFPDYVHILLLSAPKDSTKRVLMMHNSSTDTWDLPYLIYPNSLGRNGDRCAADLERMLSIYGLSDRRAFTVVAELLGAYGGCGLDEDEPVGFSQLMLVESQVSLQDKSLPEEAEWKDAEFVNQFFQSLSKRKGNYGAVEIALEYLENGCDKIDEHQDPRYCFGWFDEATRWAKAELQRQGHVALGRVVQEHISSSSTLLRAESEAETFYLKAPALGCAEIPITAAMSSLFPRNVVEVIATSEKLNSFIMRGFEHEELEEEQYGGLLMTLGDIQLASLEHMDTLKAAGCEERGPKAISEKISEWARDEDVKEIFGFEIKSLEQCVGKVDEVCSKLSEYNIPLTVVHGDFDTRNATVSGEDRCREGIGRCTEGNAASIDEKDERFMLFDWQYTCISHPFFDLHDWDENLSEEVVDGYLNLWTEYESIDRIREAFELGRHLGWCLKMWTSIECFRACNLQKKSSTAEFMYSAFESLDYQISRTDKGAKTGKAAEDTEPA